MLATIYLSAGCQQEQPVYRTGYDRLISELEPANVGVSDYLRSLRPLLPEVKRPGFNHQSDSGQDYMVLLKFVYWEASIDRSDLEPGRLLDSLPSSQLIEGYPKYVIAENNIEEWRGGLVLDTYDTWLPRHQLMSVDYPTSALDPTLLPRVDKKEFEGAILAPDRGNLFDFHAPIEEMLGKYRYRILLDAEVWDATDVYVFYGRLNGKVFGRVIINPDFEHVLEAHANKPSIDAELIGYDQDLIGFYRVIEQLVRHQQSWPDEFKEESTMRPKTAWPHFSRSQN